MAIEVEEAIYEHAIVEMNGKKVYAYEVDGCGVDSTVAERTYLLKATSS